MKLLKDNQKLVRIVHVGDAPADVLAAKYCVDKVSDDIIVSCIGVCTGKFDEKLLTGYYYYYDYYYYDYYYYDYYYYYYYY